MRQFLPAYRRGSGHRGFVRRFGTEAPGDAEAVQSGVLCRLDVDFGITDVNGLFRRESQVFQGFEDHVRRRLSPYLGLFSQGEVEEALEVVRCQFLHGRVGFIGDDGRLDAGSPELAEERADAGIFTGLDGAVSGIVGTEDVLDAADFLGVDTRRNRIAVLADVFQLFVRGNSLFNGQARVMATWTPLPKNWRTWAIP